MLNDCSSFVHFHFSAHPVIKQHLKKLDKYKYKSHFKQKRFNVNLSFFKFYAIALCRGKLKSSARRWFQCWSEPLWISTSSSQGFHISADLS